MDIPEVITMNSSIHIGDRFGHLTVIDKDNRPRHNASWLCRCDCGNEIYTCASKLSSGKHRSCGCTDHTKCNNMADLTGRQIGHLTVISRSPNLRRKSSWLCRCDCGNTIELHASSILAGKKTSCGCVHHAAKHPHEDLTGRRFGHLTVIARSRDPKYKALWQCLCDCGNELSVYSSALLSGKYTSCGNCHYHLLRTKESMIGKRFHHLTITKIVETAPDTFKLLCRCDCGEYTLADTIELTYGYKRSCGCDLQKRPRPKVIRHTLSRAQKLKTNDSIRYHKANSNTGIKGIHKRKRLNHNAYEVSITSQGIYHYIGHFPTLEDAINARLAAEAQYFAPLIQQLDNP